MALCYVYVKASDRWHEGTVVTMTNTPILERKEDLWICIPFTTPERTELDVAFIVQLARQGWLDHEQEGGSDVECN